MSPTDYLSDPEKTPGPMSMAPRTPESAERDMFAALPAGCGWNEVLSALLRRPGQVIFQLHIVGGKRIFAALALIALVGLVAYGFVVGAFSGGTQLWAAPLKIAGGALVTTTICLPSLYVLACLGGAKEQLRLSALAGVLLAALALNATLLLSFAPIAWIFSQSTDSIAFIACLHLMLWSVSFYFGLRLVLLWARFLGVADRAYLLLWMVILTLVSLQMMTTLRPIIGRSDQLLRAEKKFFLIHWLELFA